MSNYYYAGPDALSKRFERKEPRVKIEVQRSSYTDAPEPKAEQQTPVLRRCLCCGGLETDVRH